MHPLRAAGAFVGVGLACLAYGYGIERRWYATRHEVLPLLRGSGRLRILHFSDLHHVPRGLAPQDPQSHALRANGVLGRGPRGADHQLDVVRRAAERWQPDLVVSTGDNLEHHSAIAPVVAMHRDVLAITGAPGVAVLGAHDRFGPRLTNPAGYLRGPSGGPVGRHLDTAALIAGFTEGGWEVLENRRTCVATALGPVEVVGIDDPHIGRDDVTAVGGHADADPDAVLRLGLVHAPYQRALGAFDAAGFDLALAGHTHGGQLAVPGWGALVSNCDLPPAQAKGTSWQGADLRLHVSAGLGHSVFFPVRFACRPELSILDVVCP